MSLIAGSDYKAMRQKKKSKGEAFKASLHSTRNQRVVKDGVKKSRAKQIAAMPLRLATMPAGMIHDLSRGGLIQVGKNFVPRLRNAFTGDTLTNRADVKQKKKTKEEEKPKEENQNNKGKPEEKENKNMESDRENTNVKEEKKDDENHT